MTKYTAHKARYAGLGGALAAIIVWIGKQQGLDLGPIAEPIALVLTVVIGAAGGAYFGPSNEPKP